jgi:hypothetical protein
VVPILIRWGLPFVAWAGGAYLASLLVSKAVPDVPINKKNLALSSALIGGVLTSYFISETLSDHWKPAAYAGAVAGIAAGLFFLFQEPAAPPAITPTGSNILPPKAPQNQQVPNEPPGWLANRLNVQLDPRQDRTGGTVRNMLIDQPFAFSIRNQDTKQDATFFVGLDIRDSDGAIVFQSKPEPSEVGMKMMTVPAGDVKSETLTTNPINFWTPQTVTVGVSLYRNRDDATPFMSSEPIAIKMVYPGGGWLGGNETRPIVMVEVHDEMNPYHVMGCKKCKKKKKKAPFELPQGNIVYNQ